MTYKEFLQKGGEQKWQDKWLEEGIDRAEDFGEKPKKYVLDMFPYPSGAGLHVGHPEGYTATDIYSRYFRLKGFNVLHPMGWDAFGLPAENYAIKTGTQPSITTAENVATFKRQIQSLGFSYDWDREINTTDPKYYKWTQWIFLQLFKKGLAYEATVPINWCPSCKTGLSNEEVKDGKCDRCSAAVEKKDLRQWMLKITAYADRLLSGLDGLDWPESIKSQQRNWIGRSEGAEVDFKIAGSKETIKVYTTRPDTLFGATYMVLSPEHKLIQELKDRIENWKEVNNYVVQSKNKSDLERTDLNKEKTGVELKGVKAINPVNGKEIPIWLSDYVLSGYGTGAIMAVPAHDTRDWEFAKKKQIPIEYVIIPNQFYYPDVNGNSIILSCPDDCDKILEKVKEVNEGSGFCFTEIDSGIMVNSDFLDGLVPEEAIKKMTAWLEEKGVGKKAINYKLRDWVFSRQRYWGEPIPLVHCDKCGIVPLDEKNLPLTLPKVEKYEPTGTGESPLANIKEWVETKCPKCGGPAKRETNTMPQWAGSSWYYLRYIDPHNDKALVDKEKEKYWSPVDFYVGGAEHATRHLIYARFWHKFLFDIGAVSYDEPFTRLQHVGLILAEDGRKMSKRWNNVINPDEVVEKFGADAMRVYEMFMGPFSQPVAWSTNGLIGGRKFLERVWKLKDKINDNAGNGAIDNLLHKTIKKVGEDIESFKFNTAIAQMMILVNHMTDAESMDREQYEALLKILAPFAPHLTEELWSELGHKQSIFKEEWPKFDPELIKDETIELVVQVNGKVRETLEVDAGISEEEAKKIAQESANVKKWTEGKKIEKVVFVKGKLVSIVAK